MQKYSKINATDYVKDSLLALNDTHETLLSQNSGAAFPTTNLVVGMKCFRTDLNKTYTLKSIEPLAWGLTEDLNRDIYDAETFGKKKPADFARISTAESIEATSVSWDLLTTAGTYTKLVHGTSNANGPGVASYFYVDVYIYAGANITQVAFAYTENVIAIRNRYGGIWSAWSVLNAIHNHDASNITSGILPVEYGGTGNTTGAPAGHTHFPVGTIFHWLTLKPPPNWLAVNTGAILNRATYPELWGWVEEYAPLITETEWQAQAATQTSVGYYSTGDGKTTFRLPRIVDFFRPSDETRLPGSFQNDAIRNITGYASLLINGTPSGAFYITDSRYAHPVVEAVANWINADVHFSAGQVVPTADENRPKSIAMLLCVKYK